MARGHTEYVCKNMQRMELTPRLIKFMEQTIKTRPYCAFTEQLERRLYSLVGNIGNRLAILHRPINAPKSIEKRQKKAPKQGLFTNRVL
ncbi:MAG: hypothetical protein CL811_07995 [Colwelliaceae bacterium]|nr:hypothetical protein [Colwelliaceae bacterium]